MKLPLLFVLVLSTVQWLSEHKLFKPWWPFTKQILFRQHWFYLFFKPSLAAIVQSALDENSGKSKETPSKVTPTYLAKRPSLSHRATTPPSPESHSSSTRTVGSPKNSRTTCPKTNNPKRNGKPPTTPVSPQNHLKSKSPQGAYHMKVDGISPKSSHDKTKGYSPL